MLRIVFLVWIAALLTLPRVAGVQDLPQQLPDNTFWNMVVDYSEPGAFFVNGNAVSNEDDYQAVLPALTKTAKRGGIYIGVGPEQNFTYISATRPGLAFIVDIRRENMLTHLLYKALFELSANRIDFMSRLFSRKPASDLNDGASIAAIVRAYETASRDQSLYDVNLAAVYDRLIKRHGFHLSEKDRQAIAETFTYFADGPTRFWTTPNASYSRLTLTTDHEGHNWNYLATEENFDRVRDYQQRNLIVPLVGDFAGPRAIRAIGQFARDHNSVIDVFYTSNVDEYLFKDRKQDAFYSNLATLPIDRSSSMIRVVAGPGGGLDGTFQRAPGKMWADMLCSMDDLIKAFKEGEIRSRTDANRRCRQAAYHAEPNITPIGVLGH